MHLKRQVRLLLLLPQRLFVMSRVETLQVAGMWSPSCSAADMEANYTSEHGRVTGLL